MHTTTRAFSESVTKTVDHVVNAMRRVDRFEFMTQKFLGSFDSDERHPLASMRTLLDDSSRRTAQQRALIALSLSKDPMAKHVLRCVEREVPSDPEVLSFLKMAMGHKRMLSARRGHVHTMATRPRLRSAA